MRIEKKTKQTFKPMNAFNRNPIYGAIFGDIVGSRFQANRIKTTHFKLITEKSHITDDTIITLAIEKAILAAQGNVALLSELAIKHMRKAYLLYHAMDYGTLFKNWLMSKKTTPYYSYGNGGAMRVSACGVYYDTLEESLQCAYEVTRITHNHPEGLRAALSTTEAIFLAKSGNNKETIRK